MRSGLTLNGEHGASATRTMAPQPGSWCAATSRSLSASTSSSSCTTESGGSPPSLAEIVMEPRVGWNRRPTSRAAAISADHRSPPPAGATYRWSVLVVQPPRASSASATQADRYAASSSRPAHSGYRPDSQDRKSTRLNSSHMSISYAVFCLKKKKKKKKGTPPIKKKKKNQKSRE